MKSESEILIYLRTSSWLSGFIDAEGSFYLTRRVRAKREQFTHAFNLTQKDETLLLELIFKSFYLNSESVLTRKMSIYHKSGFTKSGELTTAQLS